MGEAEESAVSERQHRTRMRRLWWALGFLVLGAALVLTPPLLSVSRLQRRIAMSMSQSLGRPVHLDDVTLNILPVPGFTLKNLVVSEDPSFGAEPVIRANEVKASLRVSSLWRRQVEFGTITFEDPSVNLVRRADGRWNLETILLHAAQEDAAPTAQTKAGDAPRFPYIEATGARVNVKLGDEKVPFALTEADFALWLPSPQQWKVRLNGKPARTDTSVFDTGVLTVEATLQRAAKIADVPVEMAMHWQRAPLGEASRIFTGRDANWRGNVEVIAAAHGTLGDATTTATVKLENVRRSSFVPAKLLSVSVECNAHFVVISGVMRDPDCTLTDGEKKDLRIATATADSLDLTGLRTSGLRVGVTNVPNAWLLNWARLFSQRVPGDWTPAGQVSGSMQRVGGQGDSLRWQGEFDGSAGEPARAYVVTPVNAGEAEGLALAPVNVAEGEKAPALMLSGEADARGSTMRLSGTATASEMMALRAMVPPLGDGLDMVLPMNSAGTMDVNVVCSRDWGQAQTCVAAKAVPVKKVKRQGR